MRSFKSLNEQEILALAISLEEEDSRIYDDFAEGLKKDYPATAKMLAEMRVEEDNHRHRLIELHRQRFGEHIPLIRRQDIKGFVNRKPIWQVRPLGLAAVAVTGVRVDRRRVERPPAAQERADDTRLVGRREQPLLVGEHLRVARELG